MSWDCPSFCLLWGVLPRPAGMAVPTVPAAQAASNHPGSGALLQRAGLPAGLSAHSSDSTVEKSNILHDLKAQLKFKTKEKTVQSTEAKTSLQVST